MGGGCQFILTLASLSLVSIATGVRWVHATAVEFDLKDLQNSLFVCLSVRCFCGFFPPLLVLATTVESSTRRFGEQGEGTIETSRRPGPFMDPGVSFTIGQREGDI